MENKTFELLEKMYIKVQEMDQNMKNLEENMATKSDLEGLATKHDIVRLENKMEANDKALFDGYKQTYEKLDVLENKVDEVHKKVDNHDVEIRVIKAIK